MDPPKVLLVLDSPCPHSWGHSPSPFPRLALTSGPLQMVSVCSLFVQARLYLLPEHSLH